MTEYRYPGVGRMAFVLLSIGLPLLVLAAYFCYLFQTFFEISDLTKAQLESWMNGTVVVGTNVAFYGVIIIVAVQRLRNLGMSGWWVLLQYIPPINLWLGWRMLACPEGYADHKQLDLAGKIITACLVLLFILPLVAIVVLEITSGVDR